LDEISFRLITTFDEVPPYSRARMSAPATCAAVTATAFTKSGVDLKRVPPKSRPAAWHANCMTTSRQLQLTCTRPARTPPSTFLFLPIHLSNSLGRTKSPSPLK